MINKMYIFIICVLIVLFSTLGYYYLKVDELEKKLSEVTSSLGLKQIELDGLQASLIVKDAQIKKAKEDYKTWKAKPAKVKYKTIYKYRKDLKGKSCEEVVKSFGTIDLNKL